MPSPFPGMDPFIERQEWSDFHTGFNVAVQEQLANLVGTRYVVRVERRVYFQALDPDDVPGFEEKIWKQPDVVIGARAESGLQESLSTGGVAVAEEATVVECLLPEPVEHRESYLVVKEIDTGDVVTVIETLSPSNKRAGSVGRDEYLSKRELVLDSPTHLVELDLLRKGERLPMFSLPPGDYYALVSRARRRPRVDVIAWTLPQRMPHVPIPLKPEDPEPKLDLHRAMNMVYDRAKYGLSMDYRRTLNPPLDEESQAWVRNVAKQPSGDGASQVSGTNPS